ncbi:hypothetical protein ACFW4X_10800 [Streptomyces smyrnaeus]|uniref:hypothetical protein n=1 Tax=Streptomyces smyrnaeus TaxID=1387713 RepID=UPI0036A2B1DC
MALLTLAEAKAQLDIETDSHDVELQAYIDAITAPIEGLVGVVVPREITETVRGQGPYLALTRVPVQALTSLTPIRDGGAAVDVATLHVDEASGVIERTGGGYFSGGPWTAVYTAGRDSTPPTINLAARMLIQHLWRTQYGSARGAPSSDDYLVTEPVPGFGYAIPNRVLELLEPYKQPPGIA